MLNPSIKAKEEMNTSYKVRCRNCGTLTDLPRRGGYGKFGIENGWHCIETQIPIRCPHCLGRLNETAQGFREQVFRA